jgi:hypothetical protein
MKICVIDNELCVNVDQIVSIYTIDEMISISTTRTEDLNLITLDPYDPEDEEIVSLRERIYDEVLQELMDPKVCRVCPSSIASRIVDESGLDVTW